MSLDRLLRGRMVRIGHHARLECLTRPGEWCRLGETGRCKACPLRRGN